MSHSASAPSTPCGPVRRAAGASSLGLVLGLGALGAAAIGWWYSSGSARAAGKVDPDRVVQVERRDVLDAVTASGRVEPLARVAVMSRASGIIKALYVDEGDVVELGQVLAELDREQLEAQLAQDQADLASSEAGLAGAEARVVEARARLEDPELEFAEREAARLQSLFESGDVPFKDRDEAARALAAARFRVAQVRAGLPVLEAAVAEARADLDAAQAALDRGQTALRETTILCPMDGVVLLRQKEVGDGVSSILTAGGNATQIMVLGDLSVMHVEARIDEVDLGRIRAGMPALITVDAHRGRVLEGRVERIAPAGTVDDNGIVTFEVRVAIDDPDALLRPDMTADAKLVVARRSDVLVLPQRAIARAAGDGWTVGLVVGSGTEARVEQRRVELGLSDGLMTEITSGLEDGDRVLLPSAPTGRTRR